MQLWELYKQSLGKMMGLLQPRLTIEKEANHLATRQTALGDILYLIAFYLSLQMPNAF